MSSACRMRTRSFSDSLFRAKDACARKEDESRANAACGLRTNAVRRGSYVEHLIARWEGVIWTEGSARVIGHRRTRSFRGNVGHSEEILTWLGEKCRN